MRNVILKKNIAVALLVFVLPFLPYVHVLIKDNDLIWDYINTIEILKYQISFYGNLENLIYYPFLWFSITLMFCLLYKTANQWLRPFFLFPVFLGFCKLFTSLSPQPTENLWYIYHLILFIPFVYYFIKKLMVANISNYDKFGKAFFRSSMIAVLMSLPILYELWRFFPENTDIIRFGFMKISNYGFSDASQAMYSLLQKTCFLIPFFIYFIITKKWYRYAVLLPIIIYSAQLYNIIFIESSVLDEIEIFQTAKFTIPLLLVLFILARASDNQEKISQWLEDQYKLVEDAVKTKLLKRDTLIATKRNQITKTTADIKDLKKIKAELEMELQKIKNA